jgi:hypothetical protein
MIDISSSVLPSHPSSLVGKREENRWEQRKTHQREKLDQRHLFNGLTHGFLSLSTSIIH